MDIKQLEIVARIVELKSFSKAAESLGISQPTVSMHVQNLERELHVKLFDRLGKKVIPTPEGKLVYRYALDIIEKRNEAIKELSSFSKTFKTSVRILASNIPGEYLIPWAIPKIKSLIPSALIDMEIFDTKRVIRLLETEIPDYDIGFVGSMIPKPKLEYKNVVDDELILIAPNYYRKREIDIETLKELPLILRERDSGTRISTENILKSHRIKVSKLNVVAYLGSNTSIKEAVKRGIGFGIVSKLSVRDELTCGLIKAVKVRSLSFKRRFYAVRRKDITQNPAARAIWDKLDDIFKDVVDNLQISPNI